ncbi:hypothetical protein HRbin08_00014 [bacterium HR08]|nr:hypothetical protein HRbin08_00014 [bacterium HR08]
MKGEAEVFSKPEKSFDPVLIPKALREAGFTATEVVVTAEGTLIKGEEAFTLDVPGLAHPFVLAGGAQADTLRKRTDLVGKKIRVTGKLHPSHADHPPGLTVESFEQLREDGLGLGGKMVLRLVGRRM